MLLYLKMEGKIEKGGRKKMAEQEIRSILNKKNPAGFYVKANWIFSTPLEKIGLIIMIGLGTWKIIEFFI